MGLGAPTNGTKKRASLNLLSRRLQFAFTMFVMIFAVPAMAHQIRPGIANILVSPDTVQIELLATIEVLVADIDIAGLQDTNDAAAAENYDMLRALDPESLEQALRLDWPAISQKFQLFAGNTRLLADVSGVEIDPVGDVETTRESVIMITARLPDDATPVTFGWDESLGPLVVRQVLTDGGGYSAYLTNGEPSMPIPRVGSAQRSWVSALTNYVGIGYVHIVPKGLDHILFVLGLFFFSLHMRPLLLQVTAFTVAHTVTLALGILDVVQIPSTVVEPLIAASIVYVAVENLFFQKMTPWRTGVVFAFGLLHGLGFASVLGDIGLEPARFVTGLIGFNIGVEIGQLTIILAAFLLVGLPLGRTSWYRKIIAMPASVAIAIIGAYWFVERVFT